MLKLRNVRSQLNSNIQEKIRKRAYFLSQQDPSRPPEANWFQAQKEISMSAWSVPGWLSFLILGIAVLFLACGEDKLHRFIENTEWYAQQPAVANFVYYWIVVIVMILVIKAFARWSFISRGVAWTADGLIQLSEGKTAWDWIKILGGPSLFGAIAGVISFMYNQSNQSLTKVLASEKEREQVMNSYISDMTSMVSKNKWTKYTHDARLAISTRTLNTLESLQNDGMRQGIVLRFASRVFPDFICLDSRYPTAKADQPDKDINRTRNPECIWPTNVSLKKIQLQSFNVAQTNDFYPGTLSYADLRKANLSNSDLTRADFSFTDFQGADLSSTKYSKLTLLTQANFEKANIDGAVFDGTDLSGIKEVETNMKRAVMKEILSMLGIEPTSFDKYWLISKMVGPQQFRNSLTLTKFRKIYLTRSKRYLERKYLPREWTSTTPKEVCRLIQDGKLNFDSAPIREAKVSVPRSAARPSTQVEKSRPARSIDSYSPYSAELTEIPPNDKDDFYLYFSLRYRCPGYIQNLTSDAKSK